MSRLRALPTGRLQTDQRAGGGRVFGVVGGHQAAVGRAQGIGKRDHRSGKDEKTLSPDDRRETTRAAGPRKGWSRAREEDDLCGVRSGRSINAVARQFSARPVRSSA